MLKLRMHVGTHPAMYSHVSQSATARAHVQGNGRFRYQDQLGRSHSSLIYWWGPVSRVACNGKLGPNLHMRTCRVTVPDLKSGWTDCAQLWYTDRDQLVGCRESQLEAPLHSSARAGLNLSLARVSPQKAPYWLSGRYWRTHYRNLIHSMLLILLTFVKYIRLRLYPSICKTIL